MEVNLKKITSLVAVLILATATTAFAQKKKSLHDQFSGQGYGLAGCGLGSIVFGPKAGKIQIIAATLNGTAGSQTFGISSGTSNCDIPKMGQTAAIYIEANKQVVMKEASRGQGETLTDLAVIFNCSDAGLFSAKIQNNYEKIFVNADSYNSSRVILNTIKSDSDLNKSCGLAG